MVFENFLANFGVININLNSNLRYNNMIFRFHFVNVNREGQNGYNCVRFLE